MSRGPRSDERPSGWWRRLCQQPWLVGARGPLDFTVSLGILMALSGPKWRNWQTRMIQGHVPARVWGFKSPLRHHSSYPTSDTSTRRPCFDEAVHEHANLARAEVPRQRALLAHDDAVTIGARREVARLDERGHLPVLDRAEA